MFSRFFGSKSKINIPAIIPAETDYSFGNAAAAEAAQLLKDHKYDLLVHAYDNASGHEKTFILNKCCLTNGYGSSIEAWSLSSTSDFHSNLFHGVYLIYKAWEARSAAVAAEVSEDQANAFEDYLLEAHDLLYKCNELQPGELEVYARLIRICMGQGDVENANSCFQLLLEADEGHVGGHIFMYNLLTPKWLGSEEDIEAFKDAVVKRLEEYPLLAIIPLMHMAEVYYIWSDESDTMALKKAKQQFPGQVSKWTSYLQGKQLNSEYLNYINNYVAFLHHISGQIEERNKVINNLNPNIPLYPWGYMGIDDSEAFWNHRW